MPSALLTGPAEGSLGEAMRLSRNNNPGARAVYRKRLRGVGLPQ
jgi:hypothetical protein